MRFTPSTIKSLTPKERLYIKREGDGFSIIVYPASKKNPKGTKVWYYIYNLAGKNKKIRIGEYPAWSIAEAREKATALHTARHRGVNITSSNLDPTVHDLAARYLKNHSKKKNTAKVYLENKRNLDNDILPAIGNMKITDVKRADIYNLLEKITNRGAPVQANNVLKVVRKMFNYGIQSGLTEINPAHLIERNPERERTRVLTDEEIRLVLFSKLPGKMSHSTRRCLRFILVTGQRPGERLNMLHSEIKGDWWTIPKTKTKNINVAHAADHRVYLTPLAKEIIGTGSGKVFPTPKTVEGLGQALRRLFTSKRLKMDPFTPHDLRRTASTRIAELGFDDNLVDKLLGHVPPKLKRTYNRYQYDKEKQDMLNAWSEKLNLIGASVTGRTP